LAGELRPGGQSPVDLMGASFITAD
jgi:hypothetical protein